MRAIGLILAGGNSIGLKDLVKKRAGAAMPIGGTCRAIDFGLSNMSNSGIRTVAVLTQYNTRSLNEHLNSAKWWNFGRKHGGLYTFTPTLTRDNNWWFRGTADAIYQNMLFLRRRTEPYVVIYHGDCICKIDLNKMLEYHEEKGADITIAVKHLDSENELKRFGVVETDENNRVIEFSEKPMKAKTDTASMGIYIINRTLLMQLVEDANQRERYDLVKDIFIPYKDVKNIYAYEFDGYWRNINTVESYYDTNMDFLRRDVRRLFTAEPTIKTKIEDLPSAKFNEGSDVKNSLIGSGCIVNGEVSDSVVFKEVFIGKGAVIKNSIILNGTYIDEGAYIENCIVESRERVAKNEEFIGKEGEPMVVSGLRGRLE
ncbi:MAG: glucose-1-phosphate adenylyltransferase subunit GlgD [Lachnospiraceae bacterium]|nr:glucose-1-phosphate adenylyltransferase subunit GlgD [Lachnospiraceae bacterium]